MNTPSQQKFNDQEDYENVWVFTEIQDHERVLDGSLELLSKGREIADKLGQKLYSIVLAKESTQYLDQIEGFGPDVIMYASNEELKHFNGEIFPDIIFNLIQEHLPAVFLCSSTDAGQELAARLAYRCDTGLTAHCSNLDVINSATYGDNLLVMTRPAFSGNLNASILCPNRKPQMATAQQGVFVLKKITRDQPAVRIEIPFESFKGKLRVLQIEAPSRWKRPSVPLETASVILTGGHGMGSKVKFTQLYDLAEILGAEVATTRIPVFKNWCEEDRMVGQTGKWIKPEIYIGFGVSGQIQHTSAIMKSKRIISVNKDPTAPLHEISDYIIQEDASSFISHLIRKIQLDQSAN